MYMYIDTLRVQCIDIISTCRCRSVFLISLYIVPLAQRASYLAQHSSLSGPVAQLVMIVLSLTAFNLC